jgi:cyclic lactone autoinducer peptide
MIYWACLILNTLKEEKEMKNFLVKFAGIFAALALMVTAANVNATCMIMIHQPKLPEGAEKLRRF